MHKKLARTSVVFAVLLQIFDNRSLAYEFEVAGVMISSNSHAAFTNSLQVYVQDCQWAIFKVYEWSTNRYVTEVAYDDSFRYDLSHFETKSAPAGAGNSQQILTNSWFGHIHASPFPSGIFNTEIATVFCAYASSCYLDAHTNHLIGSITFDPRLGEWREAEEQFAPIIRDASVPGLPNNIAFLVPFQYVTNAVFTASEFTNIANVRIPLRAQVVRFDQGSTNILVTYQFQAASVSDKCSLKSFKPVLPSGTYVTDFRVPHFSNTDPGSLRPLTNGWPILKTE